MKDRTKDVVAMSQELVSLDKRSPDLAARIGDGVIKKLELHRETTANLGVKSGVRAGTSVSACTTNWGVYHGSA